MTPAKNYQNRHCLDKVIAKIKWCSFVDSHVRYSSDSVLLLTLVRLCDFNTLVSKFKAWHIMQYMDIDYTDTGSVGGHHAFMQVFCNTLFMCE